MRPPPPLIVPDFFRKTILFGAKRENKKENSAK
jgi:hypothetical protein